MRCICSFQLTRKVIFGKVLAVLVNVGVPVSRIRLRRNTEPRLGFHELSASPFAKIYQWCRTVLLPEM